MFKNTLSLKKISVRDLCFMAMLVAITIALSYISGFLRIGNSIKFSISFVSVYVGAAVFGPVAGGVIGAMADVVSFIANPTDVFLPVLTVMEFVNGFLFGLFLYNPSGSKRSMWHLLVMIFICVMLQFCVNMFWRTYELCKLQNMPFGIKFVERLPSNIALILCKFAVILFMEPHMEDFSKIIRKGK